MPNGVCSRYAVVRRLAPRIALVMVSVVFFAFAARAADIKMNAVPYCPESPLELWYPFNKTVMFLDGKMNLTKDTISFDRHGSFKYTVRTSPQGYTYLELHGLPQKHKLNPYIYLRYSKSLFTYGNQSCMLHTYECETKEELEESLNTLHQDPDAFYRAVPCNSGSYIRDVDRDRMIGLVPLDIYQ